MMIRWWLHHRGAYIGFFVCYVQGSEMLGVSMRCVRFTASRCEGRVVIRCAGVGGVLSR